MAANATLQAADAGVSRSVHGESLAAEALRRVEQHVETPQLQTVEEIVETPAIPVLVGSATRNI